MAITYKLRPEYGSYTTFGGTVSVGRSGVMFDVGAALNAQGGQIVATDQDLVSALDTYVAVYRFASDGLPLVPAIQERFRSLSVGNGAGTSDVVFEARLNGDPYPRWQLTADGLVASGTGAAPVGASVDLEALNASLGSVEKGVHVTSAPGAGLMDETALLQADLDAAAGQFLVIPKGTYLTTSDGLVVPEGTTVLCHHEAVLKPQGNGTGVMLGADSTALDRTPSTSYALTADTVVGAFTITVSTANAALLNAGQRVQLRDPVYALGGVTCRREVNVVESANAGSGVVTLRDPIGHVYLAANGSTICPITTTKGIRWLGGQVDMSGVPGGISNDCDAIYGNWLEDCLVADVTVFNHPSKGVAFYAGLNSRIHHCNAYSPALSGPGQGYNVQLEYCRDSIIEGGWSQNVRHHADIVGGQANKIIGGLSAGRPVGTGDGAQTGAFLHGLESRWCEIRGFVGDNLVGAYGAGNGTFGGDFDFDVVDCAGLNCGRTANFLQSSAGRVYGGRALMSNASDSAIAIANSATMTVEAVSFEGTMLRGVWSSSTGDVTVRGCKYPGTIGEANRADNGTLAVLGCTFPSSGVTTAARTATSATRLTVAGNDWGGVVTRALASTGVLVGTTRRETEGAAAPTAGTWAVGDRCWNTAPAAAGTPGWVCTAAGTPGTWKAMAVVAA